MRFTFSLLNAFSQRGQADNTALQDMRELTQEELDQVHGGHGKDCHNHHNNHHHNNHHSNSNSNSNSNSSNNNKCNNYYDYSYYNCYTY